jgi:hypothetical protein
MATIDKIVTSRHGVHNADLIIAIKLNEGRQKNCYVAALPCTDQPINTEPTSFPAALAFNRNRPNQFSETAEWV